MALLAASHPRFKHVKNIAMISSRFEMSGIRNTLTKEEKSCLLESGGHIEFKFSKRGKMHSIRIGYADLMQFESIDNVKFCTQVPQHTRIFLSHGSADTRVPIRDLSLFESNMKHNNCQTTKVLIPNANHGYDDKTAREMLYHSLSDWMLMSSARSKY